LVAFVYIERNAPEPLFPFDLLRRQPILIANVVSFLAGFAMFALWSTSPRCCCKVG
jgi:hypothetical protein